MAGFDASFDPIGPARAAGFNPTSGYRTQKHQDALRARGLTQTKVGAHPRGDGIDWNIPAGWTKPQAIKWFERKFPGVRAIPSNGNSIHTTFPGWGRAPDVSDSRGRY